MATKLLLVVFVSRSLSQPDGIGRKGQKSIMNKPLIIKEIIRYNERGGDAQGEVHQKNRSFAYTPNLPMKASTDASLNKTKMLLPTPIYKEADNNTGRAIVCGDHNFLFSIYNHCTFKEKKRMRYVIRIHNFSTYF